MPRAALLLLPWICLLATPPSGAQSEAQADPPATLYIYRLRAFTAGGRKMTLSLDGERLAYLQNGRYWVVKLKPGEHVLSDKDPENYLSFTAKPGEVLYIRGEFITTGLLGFNARLSLTGKETAESDLRRLKPGDKDQIQNHQLIAP